MHPKKIICILLMLGSLSMQAQTSDTTKADNKVFTKVEEEAAFPGGDNAWRNYLMRNLNAEVPVNNGAPDGKFTVIVKFIVSKDGTLSDIHAETNLGYGMEAEVIRIISRSGNWTPAYQNKRSVNAYRRQPVTFLVEDDDFTITTKVPYTLFAGTDNRISIEAKKVKPEDISATISSGSITPTGDGNFIVKVNEPGRVIITIYNSKKDKKIGTSSFEVKSKN